MPVARLAQHGLEYLAAPDSGALITQDVVEVLFAMPTASPTTPTGAGISQDVVEVLVAADDPWAAVTQDVIEVLMSADGPWLVPGGTESGGVRVFAYAG